MADNNRRQPYRPPMSRTNHNNHFRNPKSSNPNSTSSSSSVHSSYNSNTKQKEINPKENEDIPRNIVGTCPFMCPVEERERRERLRDLAVFERLHGNPAKTSSDLAVKKFCRTISPRDEQASSVRPISVLQETLNHVLGLLHSSDHSYEVVHDFVFDRTRSIRQDLSMQNLVGDQVIDMYERIVKFHIISHHHLHKLTGDPSRDSMRHLNMEQLMKALTTLLNLYQANRTSDSTYKNEAEFHSYYLLLLLGSSKQGESVSLWFRSIPSLIVKTKEMCFARRLLRYFRSGNYTRFIHTTEEEASYLQYCIIEPYINEVRILALSYICYGGYKLQPYPLVHISKLLRMKEADVESLCVDCHLETSMDGSLKGVVCTKQAITFKLKGGVQKHYPVVSDRLERLGTEHSELL